ncbi:hypothetical protein CPB85DRAFT_1276748 [Mucidula mucida]|nr:hypothetical protein CPB85DRAFT_1276748 [Mucidula mucida]
MAALTYTLVATTTAVEEPRSFLQSSSKYKPSRKAVLTTAVSSAPYLDSSPTAYPNLSTGALDDLQHDLTTVLHQTLSHPSLHPSNLAILPGKKSWLLNLDVVILADAGNIYDAIFMAARAALWDTKVPRTRSVQYKAHKSGKASADMDVDEEVTSGFDTRQVSTAADFELQDYWDEGEVLEGRDRWPVCVTLNLESSIQFLDANLQEEASSPLRILMLYSFGTCPPALQAMRTLNQGDLTLAQIKTLISSAETYATTLFKALNAKLVEEDLRRNQKARERFSGRLGF